MALQDNYNSEDRIYYDTSAVILADTVVVKQKTAKAWALDTKKGYVSNGTAWNEV